MMSNKFKDISLKSHTYYVFDDIINIKNFDTNNIKTDEKSYKNILIYYFLTLFITHFQQNEWIL